MVNDLCLFFFDYFKAKLGINVVFYLILSFPNFTFTSFIVCATDVCNYMFFEKINRYNNEIKITPQVKLCRGD